MSVPEPPAPAAASVARSAADDRGGHLAPDGRGTTAGWTAPDELTAPVAPPRLDVLKALGDNTRYAIYLELARAPMPLATADVAESLGLHVNTVRPHLERMREVGLLDLHVDNRGAVGRPTNRYTLAVDAPSLGLEPPTFPMLSRMLLRTAALAGLGSTEAAEAGREEGQASARIRGAGAERDSVPDLFEDLARLGFDPELVAPDQAPDPQAGVDVTIAFAHCPYRELAEQHPEVVCHLHRGLVEGFVEPYGDVVVREFRTIADRHPCQVALGLVEVGGSAPTAQ